MRTSGKMERGRIDQNSEGCEGGKSLTIRLPSAFVVAWRLKRSRKTAGWRGRQISKSWHINANLEGAKAVFPRLARESLIDSTFILSVGSKTLFFLPRQFYETPADLSLFRSFRCLAEIGSAIPEKNREIFMSLREIPLDLKGGDGRSGTWLFFYGRSFGWRRELRRIACKIPKSTFVRRSWRSGAKYRTMWEYLYFLYSCLHESEDDGAKYLWPPTNIIHRPGGQPPVPFVASLLSVCSLRRRLWNNR